LFSFFTIKAPQALATLALWRLNIVKKLTNVLFTIFGKLIGSFTTIYRKFDLN